MERTGKAIWLKNTTLGTKSALYMLDKPMKDCDDNHVKYVIVSSADVPFSGPETFIFPATGEGEVTSFIELEGSFQGGLCHKTALNNAGYKIVLG